MPIIQEINELLIGFLVEKKPMAEFQDEWTRLTWDIRAGEDPAGEDPVAVAAIGEVELCLAEFGAGHADWAEVVNDLVALSQKLAQHMAGPPSEIRSGSNSVSILEKFTFPWDSMKFGAARGSLSYRLI